MNVLYAASELHASGVLDWINEKGSEGQDTARIVAGVVAVVVILVAFVVSRGSLAKTLVAGFAAGIFMFLVWNITDVRDMVGNEVSGAPAALDLPGADPW